MRTTTLIFILITFNIFGQKPSKKSVHDLFLKTINYVNTNDTISFIKQFTRPNFLPKDTFAQQTFDNSYKRQDFIKLTQTWTKYKIQVVDVTYERTNRKAIRDFGYSYNILLKINDSKILIGQGVYVVKENEKVKYIDSNFITDFDNILNQYNGR